MTCGFLFLNVGTKYDDRLIVAVGSLRDFHDEPVRIMTDSFDNRGAQECIRRFDDVSIGIVDVPKRRNGAYLFKSTMGRHSPFDQTVFMDADTLTVGTVNELWTDYVVLTQWSNWNSHGKLIGGRLRIWNDTCPDLVTIATEKPWPAINTGVLSFGKDCHVMKEWEELTANRPGFICDEISFQLLYSKYNLPTVDDRFNASPRFVHNKHDVRCWHGHGNKNLEGEMGIAWRAKAAELGVPVA